MNKKINIAIDAMGGDSSPNKTIEGVKIFIEKNSKNNDFILNLFGNDHHARPARPGHRAAMALPALAASMRARGHRACPGLLQSLLLVSSHHEWL